MVCSCLKSTYLLINLLTYLLTYSELVIYSLVVAVTIVSTYFA